MPVNVCYHFFILTYKHKTQTWLSALPANVICSVSSDDKIGIMTTVFSVISEVPKEAITGYLLKLAQSPTEDNMRKYAHICASESGQHWIR